jgi:hypothetical protein
MMKDFKLLTEQLEDWIEENGLDDVLISLAQICANKALSDYPSDSRESHDELDSLRNDLTYGTPLARKGEWIKMADRLYELSHFYDPYCKCPNFVHPPFEENS